MTEARGCILLEAGEQKYPSLQKKVSSSCLICTLLHWGLTALEHPEQHSWCQACRFIVFLFLFCNENF